MGKLYFGGCMNRTKLLVVAIVLCTLSVTQATIFWGNSSGNGNGFDWQNGQSLYGLFGDPDLVNGNTFVFFPENFRAESTNGLPGSVSDKLEFELIAHPGFSFQNILVTEYGDYGILDNGIVDVSGGVTVKNMNTSNSLFSSLTTTPSMPVTDGIGEWQAGTQFTIGSTNWTHIKITLENNLFAMSQYGSTAFIEKKVLGNAISFQIIPEPATIATLGIGALFTFCNFRKKLATI